MLEVQKARQRALVRALETGEMVEMNFIHQIQTVEGLVPCFGRSEEACDRISCRWYEECMALLNTTIATATPFGQQAVT